MKKENATHMSWRAMKERCYGNGELGKKYYSKRGITVCKRWLKFDNFVSDMGERPSGMTLDRKDNSKGYFPSNCRWATRLEQSRNRNSWVISLSFKGKTRLLTDWARLTGLGIPTLWQRLFTYNWPLEKALTKPSRNINGRKK